MKAAEARLEAEKVKAERIETEKKAAAEAIEFMRPYIKRHILERIAAAVKKASFSAHVAIRPCDVVFGEVSEDDEFDHDYVDYIPNYYLFQMARDLVLNELAEDDYTIKRNGDDSYGDEDSWYFAW